MSAPSDATLTEINVDDLGRIVMALVQEVWVMRDRMAVTEALLAEHAGISADAIDDYVADPAMKARIDAMRDRFATRVVGAPVAGRERSVDQILERAGFSSRV